MNLSEEQILALAPDEASKKAGKDLSRQDKWVSYGADDAAVWGECQGSGSKPYQTQVDAQNIAFKCSCPSRKFPCKHGLGLLLLHAKNPAIFIIKEQPAWVKDWIGKRTEKSEKVADAPPKQVDEVAQVKRQQVRAKKVDDGIEDLLLWIKDIIRNGLISIPGKEGALQQMSRRMVDAQASGLAGFIKSFKYINFYKDGWQEQFLDKLVTMYLLVSGYKNIDKIGPELQKEIRALIGFPQNLDEIKAQDGIKDDWFVLGKQVKEDDQLTIERNWLYGLNTRQYALVLNFYVNNQVKDVPLAPGSIIAEGVRYLAGRKTINTLFL